MDFFHRSGLPVPLGYASSSGCNRPLMNISATKRSVSFTVSVNAFSDEYHEAKSKSGHILLLQSVRCVKFVSGFFSLYGN
ncbi:hypothetical protein D3C80_905830 [compost metagenome]